MLVLYTTALSANGRKPLAVCHHLGLAPEICEVDVYRGEGQSPGFLAVNPSGKIPALVDDGLTLCESNAILVYLAEAYGGDALWSPEPAERARIGRWLFWESAHWQPAVSTVLAGCVGHRLLPDVVPAPEVPPDWQDGPLRTQLGLLEETLRARPFLAGDALSLADFSVAGMTTYFASAGFPEREFPAFDEWRGRIEALPGWQASAAELWQ